MASRINGPGACLSDIPDIAPRREQLGRSTSDSLDTTSRAVAPERTTPGQRWADQPLISAAEDFESDDDRR